jgi:hypothetical protein
MSAGGQLLTGATLVSVLFGAPVQAEDVSCHLHAPADYASFSKQPLVIPAVGNRSECRQLNLRRFNTRGRCHCTQDRIRIDSSGPTDISPPVTRPDLLP